jgi:hypothetical protein
MVPPPPPLPPSPSSKGVTTSFEPIYKCRWQEWGVCSFYQCIFMKLLKLPIEFHMLVDEYLIISPNLLNILSRNAYVTPSLLWFGNGTNFSHVKKISIITITYRFYYTIKLSGSIKSIFHWYANPMMGNGYKWSVGALNDAHALSHIMYQNTNDWTCNYIHCHQYYS